MSITYIKICFFFVQAVVSPSSSSVFEPSSNNEHFCIDDEDAQGKHKHKYNQWDKIGCLYTLIN